MATFTAEEVQDVIERLVRSSIRRPYDTLGVRRTDVTFSDIQEAAAGVFLLYQRTPYFFAFLGTSRLEEQVTGIEASIQELLQIIGVLRRRVVPVRDVSPLANARSALFDLESAVAQGGPPRDVTKVPAFQRFNANMDRFLGQVGQNIKDSSGIVPTPNEARARIPAAVVELEGLMGNLVERVGFVANALNDYAQINLPSLVSGGVISRARQMLDARVSQLEAMTEVERLDVLRDTVLECLGTKAVVKRFGSFTPPQGLADIQGTGAPFSDATRTANEAFFDSEKMGPYALIAGNDASTSTNVLSLWADGVASFPSPPTTQFFLPLSPVAKVEGTREGPFNIQAGINAELRVLVNGAPFLVGLSAGIARTPAQVVVDITTGLTGSGFVGEAYFFPLMFEGEVQVSGNSLALAFGSFPPNSVNVGDEVDFYFGPDAPATRTVTAVAPSLANPQTITVNGGALTGPTGRIRYGAATRRVRIVPSNKLTSVQNKDVLQLSPLTTVHQQAGTTLGMFGSLVGYSKPTDAEIVATFLTANSARFRAEPRFVASFSGARLRTEPADSFTMVLYAYRGGASWGTGTLGVGVGLEEVPTESLLGQTICLREGNQPGVVGAVIGHTGVSLLVDFASAVTAANGLVEVGPTAGLAADMVVNLPTGPNSGKYFIDTVHPTIPFQFKCRTICPIFRDGFNQPAFMTGDVGEEGVRFFSKTKTLASELELRDPLTVFMNTVGPHTFGGTTKYFRLPSKPNDLEEGDFLEFYVSSLETPAFERSITRFFSDTVVELDGTISSQTPGSWPFGGTTLPRVLLRTDRVISFEEYSKALKAWLLNPEAIVRSYFIDLNRFIQPLLANQNPTDSDVGSAENELNELRAILTVAGALDASADPALTLEIILESYVVPFVAEADALIRAFKEKGADRAVDALLDCRFTAFFGMDQDELSYAGNLQKKVREVAVNDLPVRKVDRDARTRSPLKGSSESTDYEVESPDLDETPNIDPPVNGIG